MLHAEYRRFDPEIKVQSKRKEANEEIDENSIFRIGVTLTWEKSKQQITLTLAVVTTAA